MAHRHSFSYDLKCLNMNDKIYYPDDMKLMKKKKF